MVGLILTKLFLQPTQGMDIFDTFFLVEYLRQWAARGRIVILTMQPPTYEIFTMVSKVRYSRVRNAVQILFAGHPVVLWTADVLWQAP